jgi:formamidopyrimidine-DNA glycosylase
MPELPEVEVLVRHLAPRLRGKSIRGVEVRRARVLRPTRPRELARALAGARFVDVSRRAKFLLFQFTPPDDRQRFTLVGHLGMTGRMFLLPAGAPLPKHAAVVLDLGKENFVFEDTRYFGRFTLDTAALARLGPEPLSNDFRPEQFLAGLRRSRQAIKVKLLDQSLVAGLGNIYASEALFRARLSPRRAACRLSREESARLWRALRRVLNEAIEFGSTVPLDWSGAGLRDGHFYYGRAPEAADFYPERLRVYDRAGAPCPRCRTPIGRIVQAQRSTFYCPRCQR